MSNSEAYDYYGRTWMKSTVANSTLTLMEVGMDNVFLALLVSYTTTRIQLFICIYGLFAFMTTARDLRKGGGRFIVISVSIFVIATIPAVNDAVDIANTLLELGPRGVDLVQS
jgi:hypothetical protein